MLPLSGDWGTCRPAWPAALVVTGHAQLEMKGKTVTGVDMSLREEALRERVWGPRISHDDGGLSISDSCFTFAALK